MLLKDAQRGLANFLPRAERLRGKLGPILWQLPPKWNVNLERLDLHPPARTDAVQVPGELQRRAARGLGGAHPQLEPEARRDLRLLRQRRLRARDAQRAHAEAAGVEAAQARGVIQYGACR